MTQTNDDLLPGGLPERIDLINNSQAAIAASKKNTKYIQTPLVINAYKIRDIIQNPQLIAAYGLAGVSIIQLNENEVLVDCQKCPQRKANIDDYIIRELLNRNISTYSEVNGINQYSLVKQEAPIKILPKEALELLFTQLPSPVPESVSFNITINQWQFNNN